jgi:hypothetical protein
LSTPSSTTPLARPSGSRLIGRYSTHGAHLPPPRHDRRRPRPDRASFADVEPGDVVVLDDAPTTRRTDHRPSRPEREPPGLARLCHTSSGRRRFPMAGVWGLSKRDADYGHAPTSDVRCDKCKFMFPRLSLGGVSAGTGRHSWLGQLQGVRAADAQLSSRRKSHTFVRECGRTNVRLRRRQRLPKRAIAPEKA